MKSIITILAMLFLSACTCKPQKCTMEKIVDIGGCDRDGWCGVRTESGARRNATRPMVGDLVKICVDDPNGKSQFDKIQDKLNEKK